MIQLWLSMNWYDSELRAGSKLYSWKTSLWIPNAPGRHKLWAISIMTMPEIEFYCLPTLALASDHFLSSRLSHRPLNVLHTYSSSGRMSEDIGSSKDREYKNCQRTEYFVICTLISKKHRIILSYTNSQWHMTASCDLRIPENHSKAHHSFSQESE